MKTAMVVCPLSLSWVVSIDLGGVNIKLGGVNRPAPPNKLQQPNTKSIHRLSLTHLPGLVCLSFACIGNISMDIRQDQAGPTSLTKIGEVGKVGALHKRLMKLVFNPTCDPCIFQTQILFFSLPSPCSDVDKPFGTKGLLNNLVVLSFLKWDENCFKERGKWQLKNITGQFLVCFNSDKDGQ